MQRQWSLVGEWPVRSGRVTVYLESRKLVCRESDAFTIPPYAVHSVCQERDARLLSLLPFARAVFRGWDKGGKEMDTGIKNPADRITSHPEYELPIETLAAEMGFYDQSHFDKAFQKIVGISPSEYVDSKKVIRQSA